MLRASTALVLFASLAACSSGDDSAAPPSWPVTFDAGANGGGKAEAGAPCVTANDCASELACLYPTGGSCDAFKVCTAPPASPCPQPATVCSCLGSTIAACGGYSDEPIDHDGPCGDAGNVVVDASNEDRASPPVDSGLGVDASDAASE